MMIAAKTLKIANKLDPPILNYVAMKRKVLLGLMAAFLNCISLFAQERDYIPYVRDCEFGYFYYDNEVVRSFLHYWIEGEFMVDGKTYKGFYWDDSGEKELMGYLREEGRKVYFHNKEREFLTYDFTLEEGDIFESVSVDYIFKDEYEIREKVYKTGYKTIAGKVRKYINFGLPYEWVEGVGHMNSLPLWNFSNVPDCICGDQLFYIIEDGEFVYRETVWVGSEWNENYNTPIEDPYLENLAGIKDIEVEDFQIAIRDNHLIIPLPRGDKHHGLKVMDAAGRVVHCENVAGKAETLTIPTNKFARGIYIVVLTSGAGMMSRKVAVR